MEVAAPVYAFSVLGMLILFTTFSDDAVFGKSEEESVLDLSNSESAWAAIVVEVLVKRDIDEDCPTTGIVPTWFFVSTMATAW